MDGTPLDGTAMPPPCSGGAIPLPSRRTAPLLPPNPPPPRRPTGAWPRAPRQGTLDAAPVTPTCRLRLEGQDGQEGACDILELSAEGVTIAIPAGGAPRQGQQGQLLIGPAEGGYYALPVAVRWVKLSTTTSILGLEFPAAERWTYNCG